MSRNVTLALCCICICAFSTRALCDFIPFVNDRPGWEDAVGRFTSITFTEVPVGTVLDDEYADLGITFSGPFPQVQSSTSFVNDGFGLSGLGGEFTVTFDEPQLWFAVDHAGLIQMELFHGDDLIFDTGVRGNGGSGFFFGLAADMSFDSVRVIAPAGGISTIDDLHFGVPAPSVLWLLGAGLIVGSRRRRAG